MEFLYSSDTWYLISFLMFAFIIWKFGGPFLIKMLDDQIASIREEIETAENLRVEAQSLLAQYQRKQKDAIKDAEKIIENAEKQAEGIRKQADKDLNETIKRREKQLKERLDRMEEAAKEEIRQYAAGLAISATSEIIAKTLDKKANQNLVDDAIKNVNKSLSA